MTWADKNFCSIFDCTAPRGVYPTDSLPRRANGSVLSVGYANWTPTCSKMSTTPTFQIIGQARTKLDFSLFVVRCQNCTHIQSIIPRKSLCLFFSFAVFASCRIDTNNVTGFDESRDFDNFAGFKRRIFKDATGSVAFDDIFGVGDFKIKVFW